jgi:hypothetical protein
MYCDKRGALLLLGNLVSLPSPLEWPNPTTRGSVATPFCLFRFFDASSSALPQLLSLHRCTYVVAAAPTYCLLT